MFDASASGTLLDKPAREGLHILEKLAQNDYQHPTTRKGSMRQGATQLDSSDTILAQISALTNMVKNMQKQSNVQEVKNQNNTINLSTSNQQGYQNQPRKNLPQNPLRQEYQQPNNYKTGEQSECLHNSNLCLHGKNGPVHPEDRSIHGQDRDEDAEPRSYTQISGESSWADIAGVEYKTKGRIFELY
ncbi:hypothetical protein V6N13_046225 [Hibiscus sabdariffa]|uniref:Uncharacterized protein n=1 Tax=Hibiscus sabdariffa TaxID=183260 RepID=A0ABR2D9H5_9ROSI